MHRFLLTTQCMPFISYSSISPSLTTADRYGIQADPLSSPTCTFKPISHSYQAFHRCHTFLIHILHRHHILLWHPDFLKHITHFSSHSFLLSLFTLYYFLLFYTKLSLTHNAPTTNSIILSSLKWPLSHSPSLLSTFSTTLFNPFNSHSSLFTVVAYALMTFYQHWWLMIDDINYQLHTPHFVRCSF